MLLLQGDCLERMREIADSSVDMIFSDLPYGTTDNSWDRKIPVEPLWEAWLRVLKPNGVIAMWSQMPFSAELVLSNPKLFRYEWIIEKGNATGFLNARKMPLKAHENILIFYRSLPTYNPQMTHNHPRKISASNHHKNAKLSSNYGHTRYTDYDSTDRYPRDVLRFSWDKQKSRCHPTQKPVAACEYMVKTYTNPGETVLDCCMGAGSIGVATIKAGRDFVGIELDKGFYSMAEERISQAVADLKIPAYAGEDYDREVSPMPSE